MPAAQRLVAAGLAAARGRDALRPFVDRQIAADAMAGAVGVIEPGLPEELPRELSSCEPRVPSGKRAGRRRYGPCRTRVKRSFISAVGVPTITVRVTSVVPSGYWPPESTR